jgi:M6 family metalloprotease-like protein
MSSRFLLLLLPFILAGCASVRSPQANPIPSLNSKGDVYKTEGENDALIYIDALGQQTVIMLYLVFPGQTQRMSTEERAEKVLGGGKFQALFHDQSYGKLTLGVSHVHGWREMPNARSEYGTKSTEEHRDLFADVFALYPEIDLRDYDYIVANISGLGNTAFGERDELAIPYRGDKIRTALNIGSNSYFVLAHEVGHLMGLPDLYTYGGVKGLKNPTGPWDIMSAAGASTGFLGWHRHKLKWLDADRKAYFSQGVHRLKLSPLDADSGVSMLVVPADDPAHPSTVFVAEIAQATRVKGERRDAGGVLVYRVDATLTTGENPVVVYPQSDMKNAAFGPGQTFAESAAPMALSVVNATDDGGYWVDLRVHQ